LIDLYRIEIAYQIQKNWAFNEQLAGDDQSLVAAIVFKVMPDGEIRDVFFTDHSGNAYLDESAYKAIIKSNPVDSHPQWTGQTLRGNWHPVHPPGHPVSVAM
jgi:colicin import membrane protein